MIRVSNSLDPGQPNVLLGLIWVQTVCKGYQQMTLGDKSSLEILHDQSFHISMEMVHHPLSVHFCCLFTFSKKYDVYL